MTEPPFAHLNRKPDPAKSRIEDPLGDFYVWWDAVPTQVVDEYELLLQTDPAERPMQKFLTDNPVLLVQHLGGGHGRWVIPEKRLGSEYRLDFAVGEAHSMGFDWTAVEIQSPQAKFFVPSSNRTTADFDEAIRQIVEWRAWLKVNLDYARRSRVDHGLGLTGIEPLTHGLIILGRERDVTVEIAERARGRVEGMNINVHTFDWLVREARRRIAELGPEKLAHMIAYSDGVTREAEARRAVASGDQPDSSS